MPGVWRDGLLQGKVAVVTGGGTGIGLGISTLLAELGAHVVLASRSTEHLDTAVASLRDAGLDASSFAVDVREPDRVRALVDEVRTARGRIDLLVNNAAGNFYAPSATMSPRAWRAVVEIDLFGTFHCSQAVYETMKAQGGGCIVNISMTLHYRGWPQMAHATAAKAGIDALTRTLALEWAADGIRVNAVAPGPIPTEGVRRAFAAPSGDAPRDVFAIERAVADKAKSIPLGRLGTPQDIANAVVYLVSPAAEWVTGEILVVDGGEWLKKGD